MRLLSIGMILGLIPAFSLALPAETAAITAVTSSAQVAATSAPSYAYTYTAPNTTTAAAATTITMTLIYANPNATLSPSNPLGLNSTTNCTTSSYPTGTGGLGYNTTTPTHLSLTYSPPSRPSAYPSLVGSSRGVSLHDAAPGLSLTSFVAAVLGSLVAVGL